MLQSEDLFGAVEAAEPWQLKELLKQKNTFQKLQAEVCWSKIFFKSLNHRITNLFVSSWSKKNNTFLKNNLVVASRDLLNAVVEAELCWSSWSKTNLFLFTNLQSLSSSSSSTSSSSSSSSLATEKALQLMFALLSAGFFPLFSLFFASAGRSDDDVL